MTEQSHAQRIAAEVDAMLWSTVYAPRAALVAAIIDALLGDIRPGDPIHPSALRHCREPGGGKSRLARRMLDLFGIGCSMPR
jgi:hypothetical protein